MRRAAHAFGRRFELPLAYLVVGIAVIVAAVLLAHGYLAPPRHRPDPRPAVPSRRA